MAQKKLKMEQELDNGEVVKTTSEGWNKEAVKGRQVLMAGWKEGAASHHSIPLGVALDSIKKVPEAFMGNFVDEDGTKIPVVDPLVLNQAMMDCFCEKYGIEAVQIKMAGNKSGAKKELNALGTLAATQSPEVMEQLKALSPELYEKMAKLAQANAPSEVVAETPKVE